MLLYSAKALARSGSEQLTKIYTNANGPAKYQRCFTKLVYQNLIEDPLFGTCPRCPWHLFASRRCYTSLDYEEGNEADLMHYLEGLDEIRDKYSVSLNGKI